MHEFSLCGGILRQVAKANPTGLANIAQINIAVGALAGVDIESLQFWFPVVAGKMGAGQIQLQINIIPGVAVCNVCHHQFELANLYDPCPDCTTYADYQIIAGRELLLSSYQLISLT